LTEEHPQLDAADDAEPYARSKIADEDAVSERTSLNSVIGRFGNVYGPGASLDSDRATVVHALIDRAAQLGDTEDLIVWGDGHATRSLVFVTDAARGVLCCLTTGAPGEAYNIDSGQAVSIAELATLIRDEVNPSLNLVFDSSHPSGPQHRVGSIERLRALGYRPRINLPEGIARTVAWYRSQDRSGSRD
jgi:nucleoside-diphosphate-sugar epimerase